MGWNDLFDAALGGYEPVVSLLLQFGIDSDATCKSACARVLLM
jgi:hypothetical protein